MKDFSFWDEYEGASEGSGRSEKIWLINPDNKITGLFKYKKDKNTTDHISECIAYQLAQLIGLSCANFELGTYQGREGSMSYNMLRQNEILIEGINFLYYVYPDYDSESLLDKKSGSKYSIEMIEYAMRKFIAFEEFLYIPVFDYLVGNTDRHQSNWGIIYNGKKQVWAPLYDNSSSLCAYIYQRSRSANI